MEKINGCYILVVIGIFASACSQVLLKKSANMKHKSFIKSMLNWRVVTAYTIFGGALLINITAMSKGVNLKDMPILESLGYVFVPLLSFLMLKEKISRRTICATLMVVLGTFVFYL